MPKIKICKVISFSSEDPDFPSTNLLDSDPVKKWQCAKAGERTANVVLQLEQPTVITNLDIGNNYSAYISIEVGRSSNPNVFNTLLPATSFMSILECRQGVGVNKVQMLKVDDFKKPECEEKWDLVKIVCNQHFNNGVRFGVSFIALHHSTSAPAKARPSVLVVRESSPEVNSSFAADKRLSDVKGAVAIRASSSDPSSLPKVKTPLLTRKKDTAGRGGADESPRVKNRNDVLYNDEDSRPHKKIDKIIELKNKESEAVKSPKRKLDEASATVPKQQEKKKRVVKGAAPKVTPKPGKLFHRLLEGVTIVISGIQNPERGQLRTSALSMGAKYKPDWTDSSCTHLICAFANTPKFNQVKGKGKIVTQKWIKECMGQRKRLPWRRFALDPGDKAADESEEEIVEESQVQQAAARQDSDEEADENDDGGHTDEEVERLKKKIKGPPSKGNENRKNATSPKETVAVDRRALEDLPDCELSDFYQELSFYLDEELNNDGDLKRKLIQYIVAYNGSIVKDKSLANYVICNDVDRALTGKHKETPHVYPDWVFCCHNNQARMPCEDFLLN